MHITAVNSAIHHDRCSTLESRPNISIVKSTIREKRPAPKERGPNGAHHCAGPRATGSNDARMHCEHCVDGHMSQTITLPPGVSPSWSKRRTKLLLGFMGGADVVKRSYVLGLLLWRGTSGCCMCVVGMEDDARENDDEECSDGSGEAADDDHIVDGKEE